MKLDRLETHDRFVHFTGQSFDIAQCCQHLIDQKPFGDHPFYIFAHPRTDDNGIDKRLVWQPRLSKPYAQTNSMLFKAYPNSDVLKVIWILPTREMWEQYSHTKLCENKVIAESIYDFLINREKLEAPEEDDPSSQRIQELLFEYQPQLFKRETLPNELKSIWDVKMAQRIKNDK